MINRIKPLLSDLGMGSKAKYLAAILAVGATLLPEEPPASTHIDQSAATAPAGTTTIAPSMPVENTALDPIQEIAVGIGTISSGLERLIHIPLQSIIVALIVTWAGYSDRKPKLVAAAASSSPKAKTTPEQ